MKITRNILLITLMLLLIPFGADAAKKSKPAINWQQVTVEKEAAYYIDAKSIKTALSLEAPFIEVWYKTEYTPAGVEAVKNSKYLPASLDISGLSYNLSFIQIIPGKEYIPLKTVYYDKNNNIIFTDEEDPRFVSRRAIKPNTAMDKVTQAVIKIAVEEHDFKEKVWLININGQ